MAHIKRLNEMASVHADYFDGLTLRIGIAAHGYMCAFYDESEGQYGAWEELDEIGWKIPGQICSQLRCDGSTEIEWDVDIRSGQIMNWDDNVNVKVYFKVVDMGVYSILADGGDITLCEVKGEYVPKFLQIDKNGFDDYIAITINNGCIMGWDNRVMAKLRAFFEPYLD